MAAPANGADGTGRLYKKTGDDGIFWKPDSAGPEVDLTNNASPISYYNITSNTIASTNSATYILVDGMTVAPADGTYWVTFSCSYNLTRRNITTSIALFNDATINQNTERVLGVDMSTGAAFMHMSFYTQGIMVVSGNTITAQFKSNGIDAFNVYERSMVLVLLS